jgi:hypothetical protein
MADLDHRPNTGRIRAVIGDLIGLAAIFGFTAGVFFITWAATAPPFNP